MATTSIIQSNYDFDDKSVDDFMDFAIYTSNKMSEVYRTNEISRPFSFDFGEIYCKKCDKCLKNDYFAPLVPCKGYIRAMERKSQKEARENRRKEREKDRQFEQQRAIIADKERLAKMAEENLQQDKINAAKILERQRKNIAKEKEKLQEQENGQDSRKSKRINPKKAKEISTLVETVKMMSKPKTLQKLIKDYGYTEEKFYELLTESDGKIGFNINDNTVTVL
jgi:flagellar biosynthesis GTPase FlhF